MFFSLSEASFSGKEQRMCATDAFYNSNDATEHDGKCSLVA